MTAYQLISIDPFTRLRDTMNVGAYDAILKRDTNHNGVDVWQLAPNNGIMIGKLYMTCWPIEVIDNASGVTRYYDINTGRLVYAIRIREGSTWEVNGVAYRYEHDRIIKLMTQDEMDALDAEVTTKEATASAPAVKHESDEILATVYHPNRYSNGYRFDVYIDGGIGSVPSVNRYTTRAEAVKAIKVRYPDAVILSNKKYNTAVDTARWNKRRREDEDFHYASNG